MANFKKYNVELIKYDVVAIRKLVDFYVKHRLPDGRETCEITNDSLNRISESCRVTIRQVMREERADVGAQLRSAPPPVPPTRRVRFRRDGK